MHRLVVPVNKVADVRERNRAQFVDNARSGNPTRCAMARSISKQKYTFERLAEPSAARV